MMWIYFFFFFLTESWSLSGGTNTTMISNTTTPAVKYYVDRNEVYNHGSNVILTCSNKTWNEILYVIWKIELKRKACTISFSNNGQSVDDCNDGKSLKNNSIGQSYLNIPNFSANDVGTYKCESVYHGGNEYYNIKVAVTAPPRVSAWLEYRGNKMVAVCRAESGNPAANISWSPAGNDSVTKKQDPDGFVTVESQLELPENTDRENLTCIIRHQYWDQEEILVPELRKAYFWSWILIPVIGVIFVILAAFSALVMKKVVSLRQCQNTDTPSKSPSAEEVEEVEPYASYVQRVNSIYN
ncbi:PREDICTED: cell surface glycoprotein CD200 receptor 1-A-like [Cyprinodon variegatus]|uniref:Cell surface glycoprotein CD200 receptor 1-A-like n=1 Tax=Cyprinodon variegatus TaxID=28743 RepID=A0A3Q2EF92_CYPVA|nr:PREDICTED: cell surface glycoprotein CD200 receptor 1-A-like [Cyprinodon variegatus]